MEKLVRSGDPQELLKVLQWCQENIKQSPDQVLQVLLDNLRILVEMVAYEGSISYQVLLKFRDLLLLLLDEESISKEDLIEGLEMLLLLSPTIAVFGEIEDLKEVSEAYRILKLLK